MLQFGIPNHLIQSAAIKHRHCYAGNVITSVCADEVAPEQGIEQKSREDPKTPEQCLNVISYRTRPKEPRLPLPMQTQRHPCGPRNTPASKPPPCRALQWPKCYSKIGLAGSMAYFAMPFQGSVAVALRVKTKVPWLVFDATSRFALDGEWLRIYS